MNKYLPLAFVAILGISAFLLGLYAPGMLHTSIAENRTKPRAYQQKTDFRPARFGNVEVGAFAPEALLLYGINGHSISALDGNTVYQKYRTAVRNVYGADLADMNYLGVGLPDWNARYESFQRWLIRAGTYGAPTVALEPIGKSGFGVFADSLEMRRLRDAFEVARKENIIVWVRFASECNLRLSSYSVYNNAKRIARYRESVRWFRRYMPSNVRLVFCPLINTVYLKQPEQLRTIRQMYIPGDYDRIGGTIYATFLRLKPAYDWYYKFMRKLDANTPFQICELGGPTSKKKEMLAFIDKIAQGEWPAIQKVNLFAGSVNGRATSENGGFGFVIPGETRSYLFNKLNKSAISARSRIENQSLH